MIFALLFYSESEFSRESDTESQERILQLLQVSLELGDGLKQMCMLHPDDGVTLQFAGAEILRYPAHHNQARLPLRGVAFLEADNLEEAIAASARFRPRPESLLEIRPALLLK